MCRFDRAPAQGFSKSHFGNNIWAKQMRCFVDWNHRRSENSKLGKPDDSFAQLIEEKRNCGVWCLFYYPTVILSLLCISTEGLMMVMFSSLSPLSTTSSSMLYTILFIHLYICYSLVRCLLFERPRENVARKRDSLSFSSGYTCRWRIFSLNIKWVDMSVCNRHTLNYCNIKNKLLTLIAFFRILNTHTQYYLLYDFYAENLRYSKALQL